MERRAQFDHEDDPEPGPLSAEQLRENLALIEDLWTRKHDASRLGEQCKLPEIADQLYLLYDWLEEHRDYLTSLDAQTQLEASTLEKAYDELHFSSYQRDNVLRYYS